MTFGSVQLNSLCNFCIPVSTFVRFPLSLSFHQLPLVEIAMPPTAANWNGVSMRARDSKASVAWRQRGGDGGEFLGESAFTKLTT